MDVDILMVIEVVNLSLLRLNIDQEDLYIYIFHVDFSMTNLLPKKLISNIACREGHDLLKTQTCIIRYYVPFAANIKLCRTLQEL